MDNANEPKLTLEQIVDNGLNPPAPAEQQGDKLAPTEQPTEMPSSTGEVQKTQETVQKPETDKDKGFANHPAWQEREAKLKEAREALAAKEREAQRYAQLLDEYQKKQQQGGQKEAAAQSVAEKACKKLGWDINRLNEEQRAYIQDHVNLTMAAMEDYVKETLDKRLAPFERSSQEWHAQQAMQKAEARWGELSKEDGLEINVVKAAIENYCLELDKRDPDKTIQLSDEDLYLRATRQLLRERETSQSRQEARSAVKANARPLGQAPQAKVADAPSKPQKPIDFLEKQLDSLGIR